MPTSSTRLWWPRPFAQPTAFVAQRIVVITDLDGTILEHGTTSVDHARAALDFLASRGIPVIVNSHRTRVEVERLHQTLHMVAPFITENGSALFLPLEWFPFVPHQARPGVGSSVIEYSKRYHQVVEALRETCRRIDVRIVGFADLSIEEVGREINLPLPRARLAKLREYSEIFRIVDENERVRSRLFRALRRQGLRCWRAHHHHLVTAAGDRGESVRGLRTIWKQAWGHPFMIGLGDSDDDVAWLKDVDVAIVVPNDHTGVPPRVLSKLPTAHVTRMSGPRGWSDAVFEYVGALLSSHGRTQPASQVSDWTDPPSDGQPP